jgi:hypothetical protein
MQSSKLLQITLSSSAAATVVRACKDRRSEHAGYYNRGCVPHISPKHAPMLPSHRTSSWAITKCSELNNHPKQVTQLPPSNYIVRPGFIASSLSLPLSLFLPRSSSPSLVLYRLYGGIGLSYGVRRQQSSLMKLMQSAVPGIATAPSSRNSVNWGSESPIRGNVNNNLPLFCPC